MKSKFDLLLYAMGIAFGVVAGWLHVWSEAHDPLMTALVVLVFTMLLGFTQPERPWRWTVVLGVSVPTYVLIARFGFHEQLKRGEVWGSFVAVFSGFAGAYGGAMMRHAVRILFPTPEEKAERAREKAGFNAKH